MNRHKTAVIGLGNTLLSDEGAGLHALRLLEDRLNEKKNVDLVEAGICGMNLLHQFEDREKIIFIDAGNCGVNPGEFRRFHRDEVNSLKKNPGHSLHEFDLIALIDLARKMDEKKNIEVVIYCIQPAEIKIGERLSPVVEATLPILVEQVYNEISRDPAEI